MGAPLAELLHIVTVPVMECGNTLTKKNGTLKLASTISEPGVTRQNTGDSPVLIQSQPNGMIDHFFSVSVLDEEPDATEF